MNFTFIKKVEKLEEVNFKIFTHPIVTVLQKLGLDAYSTGRNDLMIDGKKISGNAEHIFRKRVLHHGTLLFDSQLDKLRNALNVDLSRFEHKAVQSNRSEVGNISDYQKSQMSVSEFSTFIFENILRQYQDFQILELSPEDIAEIKKLRDEKYCLWDWIYGYSPKYTYRNKLTTENGEILFYLNVKKGKIIESGWEGAISQILADQLSNQLQSKNHEFDVLKKVILELEHKLSTEQIFAQQLLAVIV